MSIGLGVWAFVAYLAVVIGWSTLLKRSMPEAMLMGLLVVVLFNGPTQYFSTLFGAVSSAVREETFVATLMFVLMAAIMTKTGIINQLVDILNSLVGRLRGGPAYVAVLGSALFGLVSGNSVANAATIGAITVPWMIESGWPKEAAAVINAGNSGSGQSFPTSNAMFIMLALPEVAALVTIDNFYLAMLTAGLWCVLYRLLIVRFFVHKYKVPALPSDKIRPLGEALHDNWTSLLMFVSVIIPLVLTLSPLAGVLKATSFGADGVKAISIVVWVPVLMCLICMALGRKKLPQDMTGWGNLLKEVQGKVATVGGIFLFALSGSKVLSTVGFGDDFNALISQFTLPKAVMIILVGIAVAIVAGPLSGVATTVAMGPVTFALLVSVGVPPIMALATFLVWMSTEGAAPPGSSPIPISCGFAGVDQVGKTFKPLVIYYVLPVVTIGVLISMGILPIANGYL